MIVKQKKMDKRINYKINLERIMQAAIRSGLWAIKTNRISGSETKKIWIVVKKEKVPESR